MLIFSLTVLQFRIILVYQMILLFKKCIIRKKVLKGKRVSAYFCSQVVVWYLLMLCAIWYHFYNIKNVKKTYGGELLLGCFAKINTFPWVFFTFLYCAQIAQSITYFNTKKISSIRSVILRFKIALMASVSHWMFVMKADWLSRHLIQGALS